MKISEQIRQAGATASPQDIKKIRDMIAKNDHVGARLHLAQMIKERKLSEAYQGVAAIQRYFGSLPPGLGDVRDAMDTRLKALVQRKLDNAEEALKAL